MIYKNRFFSLISKGKYWFPVGIIAGDHDFLSMRNGLIKKWVRDLADVKISIIENAGYIIWIDQPVD